MHLGTLDGDGLELTPRTGHTPYFDVDGDNFAERTSWVRGDDGLLVADANSNGKVDGFDELFGSPTASGFVELKSYDSNSDGKVDAPDDQFAALEVWQDKDLDGVTDAGELRSLADVGIASINVAATDTDTTIAVQFDANQYDSKYLGDTSVDPVIAATMPNLKCHGTLVNLHVARSCQTSSAAAQPRGSRRRTSPISRQIGIVLAA